MNVTVTLNVQLVPGSYDPIDPVWQKAINGLGEANAISVPPLFKASSANWTAVATVVESDLGQPAGQQGKGASVNSWQEAVAGAFSALGYQ